MKSGPVPKSPQTGVPDPLEEINRQVARKRIEDESARMVSAARARLILDKNPDRCFFKVVSLQMDMIPKWDIETACTDGSKIWYNPEYVSNLMMDELIGVICGHEPIHCCLGHQNRRGNRDQYGWNIACDLAVNQMCEEAGFTLPKAALLPGKEEFQDFPPGLSAEAYYERLVEEAGGSHADDFPGDGSGDPGKCGEVTDSSGDEAGRAEDQQRWDRRMTQAADLASKETGTLPGGLASLIDSIRNPKVPWQEILRDFVSRTFDARDDYNWMFPNRRYISQGIYLPGLRSESIGHVLIHVDVSGSTQVKEIMDSFAAELNGALDAKPCKATILYGDTEVQKSEEWSPVDGPIKLSYTGGGGTNHDHLSEFIHEMDEPPVCVIALTDGYTSMRLDPQVPLLWAVTPDGRTELPFGRTIVIGEK